MLHLRNLGLKKGDAPAEKFEHLLANGWGKRFAAVFPAGHERAIAIFRKAHGNFLQETYSRTTMDGVPDGHRRSHIEFTLRSFFGAWKRQLDPAEIDALNNFKGRTRPSSLQMRANMLYGLDALLDFMEAHPMPASCEAKYLQFFQELAKKGILADPLFLRRILGNPKAYLGDIILPSEHIIGWLPDLLRLIKSRNEKREGAASLWESNNELSCEDDLAARFNSAPSPPLGLGGRFAFHTVDGQIGERIWMLPEEIQAQTAQRLASILAYGLVPGGIVGGSITHTDIFFGIDRPDIDLLTVYPELQAVVFVPVSVLAGCGYPSSVEKNTRAWHDGDKAVADQLTLTAKEGELPHVSEEKISAVVPSGLLGLVHKEIQELSMRVGRGPTGELCEWLGRVIPYEPKYWGNIHRFLEFLQTSPEGLHVIRELYGGVDSFKDPVAQGMRAKHLKAKRRRS